MGAFPPIRGERDLLALNQRFLVGFQRELTWVMHEDTRESGTVDAGSGRAGRASAGVVLPAQPGGARLQARSFFCEWRNDL